MSKQQREEIYRILQNSRIQQKSKQELNALMMTIGFQDDVLFAKSLFADKIIQIYNQCNAQYEQFLALDHLHKIPSKSRQFLFAVFRKYHEYRLKNNRAQINRQEQNTQFSSFTLPNPNNIQEIIKFQKNMYEQFKNLAPPRNPTKFPSFPIVPEPTLRNFDGESYRPYEPSVYKRQSEPPINFKRRSQYSFNGNEHFSERPSFFSKVINTDIFNQSVNQGNSYLNQQEKEKTPKNFSNYYDEEVNPVKKLKRDYSQNVNFTPRNMQSIKKQIEAINQAKKVIVINRDSLDKADQIIPNKQGECKQPPEEQSQ